MQHDKAKASQSDSSDRQISTNKTSQDDMNTSGSDQQSPVLFHRYETDCGHIIAEITLNDPKSLNALSVDICQLMSAQLIEWQNDDKVAAVLLRGAGDKAFCAGGNIRKLYDSMNQNTATDPSKLPPNPYATEFFGSEYDLYRQMHFFPKPLILWGDGIIMGGGMGLMAACSHRIVTPNTRFAMPEITIGLFPDATGSWFLQRMPAKMGLFLGLTGAQCHGIDAKLINLAEYVMPSSSYEQVVSELRAANWRSKRPETDRLRHGGAIASRVLSAIEHQHAHNMAIESSKLVDYWQAIHTLMNSGGLKDIDAILQDDDKLAHLDGAFAADPWTQRAVATYRKGCAVTAALTYEIYHKVAGLSLEQILYIETNVAVNCANRPDFKEGIRALLIDKDRNPTWSRTLAECLTPEGQAYIGAHFDNPYPEGEHPFSEWLTNKASGARSVY